MCSSLRDRIDGGWERLRRKKGGISVGKEISNRSSIFSPSRPLLSYLKIVLRTHSHNLSPKATLTIPNVGYFLPLLSRAIMKTIGCTDYNIVQNNGIRAAQVVPHVHFHIIPRPETRLPSIGSQSWTMFGRGLREDLDDEEGEKLARELREELRRELKKENRGNL